MTTGEVIALIKAFGGGGGSSGGGVLVVNFDGTALDKTWQEISDAGVCVISATLEDTAYYMPVTGITTGSGKITPWSVTAITVMEGNTTILTFNASSATDYPAYPE